MKNKRKQLPTLSEYMEMYPQLRRYYYKKYPEQNYPKPHKPREEKIPTLSEYMEMYPHAQLFYYKKYPKQNYPKPRQDRRNSAQLDPNAITPEIFLTLSSNQRLYLRNRYPDKFANMPGHYNRYQNKNTQQLSLTDYMQLPYNIKKYYYRKYPEYNYPKPEKPNPRWTNYSVKIG